MGEDGDGGEVWGEGRGRGVEGGAWGEGRGGIEKCHKMSRKRQKVSKKKSKNVQNVKK